MGDTWITDMSDFDYKEEEAHRVHRQAKKLAEYFASIILRTMERLPMDGRNTGIRCRRRPGRRPCMGAIESEMQPQGNELRWWCPVCGDNGRISNWVGTRWEPKKEKNNLLIFSKLREMQARRDKTDTEETEWAAIEGDGASDGQLPESVTEVLTGKIMWDEEKSEFDRSLPRIITTNREYAWEELGEKLLEYEGWKIRIEVF